MANKKKSSNPVGRPRKKRGKEALLNHKKSFKIDNNCEVVNKRIDALILLVAGLIAACIVMFVL